MSILVAIIAIVVLIYIVSYASNKAAKKARAEAIYKKYGHTEIAERIIKKIVWVGETTDQLLDSLGKPVDTDENVLKTKTKEIWKYCQKSANRYGFKVKVENGIVVGWDEKL
jgi:hypothetical protein